MMKIPLNIDTTENDAKGMGYSAVELGLTENLALDYGGVAP